MLHTNYLIQKKAPMHIYLLEIDEENPCVAFRCLFLSRKSPLHQRWGCFSNIKHHFQWRIIKTAPVRYAACLAVIFFGHRPAPKYVLKCSKNGSYIIVGGKNVALMWCTEFLFLLLPIKNLHYSVSALSQKLKEWKDLAAFLFSSPASPKLLPFMSLESNWKQRII